MWTWQWVNEDKPTRRLSHVSIYQYTHPTICPLSHISLVISYAHYPIHPLRHWSIAPFSNCSVCPYSLLPLHHTSISLYTFIASHTHCFIRPLLHTPIAPYAHYAISFLLHMPVARMTVVPIVYAYIDHFSVRPMPHMFVALIFADFLMRSLFHKRSTFSPHLHYLIRLLLHASISSYAHCPIRNLDQLPHTKIFYCYLYLLSTLESSYFRDFKTWISRRGFTNLHRLRVANLSFVIAKTYQYEGKNFRAELSNQTRDPSKNAALGCYSLLLSKLLINKSHSQKLKKVSICLSTEQQPYLPFLCCCYCCCCCYSLLIDESKTGDHGFLNMCAQCSLKIAAIFSQ